MNHKLYEDWLFTYYDPVDDELTSQQTAELKTHLQGCETCQQLIEAWKQVDGQLRHSPVAAPAPGFTMRWQTRLEADRQRLYRRQTLAVLAFCIAGAVLLFSSLLVVVWPWLRTPDVFWWAWLYRTFTLASYLSMAGQFLNSMLQTASGVVPITGWMLFTGILCEMGVLWVVSYRLLTNPRRIAR